MSANYPKAAAGHERIYRIWCKMRERCSNPRADSYANYGAKGVAVCAEWADFGTFLTWALASGYGAHLTIERRNSAEGYRPSNCAWATRTEQNQHRSIVAMHPDGTAFCEVARRNGISQSTFRNRIARGWSLADASTLAAGNPPGVRVRLQT